MGIFFADSDLILLLHVKLTIC